MAAPVKKQRPGTFSATYQPKHRRTADRIPHNVKADVVAGLAAHGEDGKGKGGFRGYIKYLAGKYPKQAARLIERLLPPSVVVANTGPKASIHTVNVVSVPSGTFLSSEEIQNLRSGAVPIEHAPLRQLEQLEPLEHFEPSVEPSAHGIIAQSPEEERLIAELSGMSYEELMRRAERLAEQQGWSLEELMRRVEGADVESN